MLVMENKTKVSKPVIGVVNSVGMDKSAKMEVSSIKKHPLYKKYLKRDKSIIFHDENNECKVGDTVKVVEVRPLSKQKRHRLVEIVKRAE